MKAKPPGKEWSYSIMAKYRGKKLKDELTIRRKYVR